MKLFHGSLVMVEVPEIRVPNRTLDYGSGFYATTSYEQAEAWTRRRMNEEQQTRGFVNVYEFSLEDFSNLDIISFDKPNEDWLDFVMRNRTEKDFHHSHDIVYGPVANDRVYAAFALYEGGVLNEQELIAELKTYKLVDQYLFHTEKALETLTFVEAKEVAI